MKVTVTKKHTVIETPLWIHTEYIKLKEIKFEK